MKSKNNSTEIKLKKYGIQKFFEVRSPEMLLYNDVQLKEFQEQLNNFIKTNAFTKDEQKNIFMRFEAVKKERYDDDYDETFDEYIPKLFFTFCKEKTQTQLLEEIKTHETVLSELNLLKRIGK